MEPHADHGDEGFDAALLDTVGEEADELLAAPLAELPGRLRALVRRTITARRPDGSWPPAELLFEALRTYLDVFDERLRSEGVDERVVSGDTTWITAWRECAGDLAMFDRLLDELRSEDDTSGIPRYPPPDDLRLIVEP